MTMMQATPINSIASGQWGGRSSSASRFTSRGPACLYFFVRQQNRFMKTIAIMMMFAFTSHVFAQVNTPPAGPVRPLSPAIINPKNGHTYLLLSQGNWTDSEAEAVALGGHLATIRNQAEEDFVSDFFTFYGGQRHGLWIGLREVGSSNRFIWVTRNPVRYTDWFGGGQPPNNTDGSQPYVAIMDLFAFTNPSWVNWSNGTTDYIGDTMNGVVEIDRK